MSLNIVFLDEATIPGVDLTAIKSLGNYSSFDFTPDDKVVERSIRADIVITNKVPLKADVLSRLPKLKMICIAATGMNNVDLKAAEEAGIRVANAKGYSSHSVAELTVCMVLALYRQLIFYDDYVKSGAYTRSSTFSSSLRKTFELHGKKWGIIGLGDIGKAVARLATAFGCEVAYYSTSGMNDNKDYTKVELNTLLSDSDIISVHAPLSRQTYHLLDYPRISLMKKSAVVVNVARGSIIDEEALTSALNEGLIAGAAVDVYGREPMTEDNALNNIKDRFRLITTPHIAWSTGEALQRLIDTVAENIKSYLNETNEG